MNQKHSSEEGCSCGQAIFMLIDIYKNNHRIINLINFILCIFINNSLKEKQNSSFHFLIRFFLAYQKILKKAQLTMIMMMMLMMSTTA